MAAGRIKGITIEIGGDTTKLVSALSKVDNALSKTQTNLRDINKALKLDPGNTELLKDKQNELARAISESKQRLDAEKEAYAQLASADQTEENVEKMRQLKTQIDLDTVALEDLEKQAKQASSVFGSQMTVAGQKMEELGNKVTAVGDKLASIGSAMTTTVTTPIVAGFAAAVKTTGDFDAAMSKVQAVSGASADDMVLLRDKAKEMGETTKFSASESAEALNYMAMAGWKTEDMLGGIEGVMNLAAASGEDLGTTADIVTDALTAFGYTAEDSGRFADILAAAASNANTNVSMMGESFKYAAPVAGALGYSAEDVAVALGLMANSGIKADQAGTSLRNMFNRMAKPTKESAAAMERLGLTLADDEGNMYSFREIMDQLRDSMANINVPLDEYNAALDELDAQLADGTLTQSKYDAALEELNQQTFGAEGAEKARAAAMLGGTRAMSGLLAIANASEADYEKLTAAIDDSSQAFAKLADGSVVPLNEALASGAEIVETYNGSAEAMANTMLDNLPGQLTLLKSQIEGLAISFGELLMPTVRQVVTVIQGFMDKLNALDESQKQQIIQIAAVVAAIGPALLAIGKITSLVGSVMTVVGQLMSFLGPIISSMGGLQAILTVITGPIGIIIGLVAALAAGFTYLYNTNETFRAAINTLITEVQTRFAEMLAAVQPALEGLKEAFNGLVTALAPIGAAIAGAFNGLISATAPFFEFIAASVVGLVDGFMGTVAPIIDIVTNTTNMITAVIQAFEALLQGDLNSFMTLIDSAIQSAIAIIINIIQAGFALIKGFFSAFGVDVVAVFTKLWNSLKVTVASIVNTLKTSFSSGFTALKSIVNTGINTVKSAFETMKTSIKSVFDNLLTNMKQWGKDMIDGFIQGIKDKISAVGDAIGEIADTIASYLHFSVPDIGPLADADTYAPDMMKLFAKGIRDNANLITDALTSSFNLSPILNQAGQTGINVQGTGSGSVQPINVNLTLEGDASRIFRLVNIEASKNYQVTGQVFNSTF